MAEETYNPFGFGAMADVAGYQLMHPGLPGAISRDTIKNAARYGLRGWHGLSFGLTNPLTSRIAAGSEALSKRTAWKGYRHIHGSVNFMHQLFSGGAGAQKQITLLGGKTFLGPMSLSTGEAAVAKKLADRGFIAGTGAYNKLLQTHGRQMGLLQSLASSIGWTGPTQRAMHTSISNAITGSARFRDVAAMTYSTTGATTTAENISQVNRIIGTGQMTNVVSKKTAWKLGASRALGAATPFFGMLNTFFVIDLAFKAGEFGGQLVGATATALREANRSIGRLELGGSTAAFQTGGAVTERQRAVQAIQMNSLNARQAIGQEAMYMHG